MKIISVGKLRGLQQCASQGGTFTALALDHRQNLRTALNPQNSSAVSDAVLTAFKLQVAGALAGQATAVLLDPQYSSAQAIAAGIIPTGVGLVTALESTGYGGEATARKGQVLPGWSVAKAKRMGASMVKLLVYYHPNATTASEIEDFVTQVAGECLAEDLGLMLEPLSYSLDPAVRLSSGEKRAVVIETARRLTIPGVDLLKCEFPFDAAEKDEDLWREAYQEISATSTAPWILLSAAVDFDLYLQQVRTACECGASGIAVGRAVWQEAVRMSADERTGFLQTTARSRLWRLKSLCQALAKPFTEFYRAGEIRPDWYRNY